MSSDVSMVISFWVSAGENTIFAPDAFVGTKEDFTFDGHPAKVLKVEVAKDGRRALVTADVDDTKEVNGEDANEARHKTGYRNVPILGLRFRQRRPNE